MKIAGLVSMLESSYGKLPVTANSLLNGIRIKHEDTWYLVGQACRNMGRNPHRLVNASPDEIDYQVLLQAALLLSTTNITERINLSMGFPYSTYNIYRGMAEKMLAKNKTITLEFDTASYKKDGLIDKKIIEIDNFEIIPELAACVIGLKKHYRIAEENFLIISLGFGTTEIGVVTSDGLNKRTVISVPGIVRCIKNLRDELERDYFLGFMTDHQLDDSFIKGSLIMNRQKVDISDLRSIILKSFYKEYISDTLRSMISDRDFERIEKIYVCGGATHYEDLQNSFKKEFEELVPIEFVKEPDTLASIGYYYNSVKIANSFGDSAVGIDLGNSSTYICTSEEEK